MPSSTECTISVAGIRCVRIHLPFGRSFASTAKQGEIANVRKDQLEDRTMTGDTCNNAPRFSVASIVGSIPLAKLRAAIRPRAISSSTSTQMRRSSAAAASAHAGSAGSSTNAYRPSTTTIRCAGVMGAGAGWGSFSSCEKVGKAIVSGGGERRSERMKAA